MLVESCVQTSSNPATGLRTGGGKHACRTEPRPMVADVPVREGIQASTTCWCAKSIRSHRPCRRPGTVRVRAHDGETPSRNREGYCATRRLCQHCTRCHSVFGASAASRSMPCVIMKGHKPSKPHSCAIGVHTDYQLIGERRWPLEDDHITNVKQVGMCPRGVSEKIVLLYEKAIAIRFQINHHRAAARRGGGRRGAGRRDHLS